MYFLEVTARQVECQGDSSEVMQNNADHIQGNNLDKTSTKTDHKIVAETVVAHEGPLHTTNGVSGFDTEKSCDLNIIQGLFSKRRYDQQE